ncbi:hypothetical protein LUX09_34245 [Streptomyces albogriseolus]|nr:hypothetical protein [Streptomyces albogriseolus]
MTAIDELLADARIPTGPRDGFDVGAALRRLAADAAAVAAKPHPDTVRAAQAGQRLSVVCRWILNRPDAADHVDRLAQEPATPEDDGHLDVDGALVFACLLYLTDHRESAQFWWQLAAGAGHRAAAYCLHLHHLALGESREARHWLHVVTDDALDSGAPTAPSSTPWSPSRRTYARPAPAAQTPPPEAWRWRSTAWPPRRPAPASSSSALTGASLT